MVSQKTATGREGAVPPQTQTGKRGLGRTQGNHPLRAALAGSEFRCHINLAALPFVAGARQANGGARALAECGDLVGSTQRIGERCRRLRAPRRLLAPQSRSAAQNRSRSQKKRAPPSPLVLALKSITSPHRTKSTWRC